MFIYNLDSGINISISIHLNKQDIWTVIYKSSPKYVLFQFKSKVHLRVLKTQSYRARSNMVVGK